MSDYYNTCLEISEITLLIYFEISFSVFNCFEYNSFYKII